MKLSEGEAILMEMRPERQILVIWLLTNFLGTAVALTFLTLIFLPVVSIRDAILDKHMVTAAIPYAIGGTLLLLIVVFVYCIYLRRTYVYIITNQRCVFIGGILLQVEHSVPFHKITDVERNREIAERWLGISNLAIYTPGTGSLSGYKRRPEIEFKALKDSESPAQLINRIVTQCGARGE